MKAEYILQKFNSGMHYIMIDTKTVEKFKNNGTKRAICIINDQIDFHCAFMPKKEGGYYINIGSSICKKLKIKEGSTIIAKFKKDDSEYQFEMPEELNEVLKSNNEAMKAFKSLSDGKKRSLIYIVTQVKSIDKRIERSLKIVDKLKK